MLLRLRCRRSSLKGKQKPGQDVRRAEQLEENVPKNILIVVIVREIIYIVRYPPEEKRSFIEC